MPSDLERLENGNWGLANDAGETLELDQDGYLVALWDADGEPADIDPGRFGYDPDAPMGVADLWDTGEDAAEPQPQYEPEYQPSAQLQVQVSPAEPDVEDTLAAYNDEFTTLASTWGRKPLLSEEQRLIEVAQTRGCSILEADTWLAYNDRKWNPPQLDDDHERAEVMTKRILDNERIDRAERFQDDDLTAEREPHRGKTEFNANVDSERGEYLGLRLQGVEGISLYDGPTAEESYANATTAEAW